MKSSTNKKHIVSVGSDTAEARRSRRVWLGNGLSVLPSSNIEPSPRRKVTWARVSSFRHMTATEVMMGQEREYMELRQGGMERAQSRSGHKHVRSYYDAIKHLPRTSGVLDDVKGHLSNLEGLDAVNGNMYYSEKDEMFVGDWSIQSPEIYHRHKELGTYFTMDGMDFTGYHDDDLVVAGAAGQYKTHIQWDAAKGECGLCGEHMSGEVMMMHLFYQF